MLTQGEKEWLEHRDAMQFLTGTYIADFAEYPLWNSGKDWQEAAEFEARVAAKLAKKMLEPNRYQCRSGSPQLGCMRDWSNLTGPMAVHCEDCILREVRLQVEEEMDGKA
jgi:hypothetical protein